MSSAIFYAKDAFRINKNKIMGRQVAGNDFLEAYCKFTKYSQFWVYSKTIEEANDFANFAKSEGVHKTIKFINFANTEALKEPGLLFYPGPDISMLSKNRSFFKDNLWSICGVTHTTCTSRVMRSIESLNYSPIQPWDALICTSKAVHSNVLKIIKVTEENLRNRNKATTFIRPQLPVIPLGINTSRFSFTKQDKYNAREIFKINNDEIVILYLGRLSFHAKANPFPMYKALEKASKQAQKKIVLIECGWYANNKLKNAFEEASEYLCPNIRIVKANGNEIGVKHKALAAADIFCSFADNIQETFGITPVEAMASGLPVVVSDWDGYKDIVREGIDGFRIPTLMPPSDSGNDLAFRYAIEIDSYDMYLGYTSNLISVDIELGTKAFYQLFTNERLRNEMGDNARNRAKNTFDWSRIIIQYLDLWKDLQEIRRSSESVSFNYKSPDRLDPFYAFSSYSTNIISDKLTIGLIEESADLSCKKVIDLKNLYLINYASFLIPDQTLINDLFNYIEPQERSIKELESYFYTINSTRLIRAIIWLHKYNLIKVNI